MQDKINGRRLENTFRIDRHYSNKLTKCLRRKSDQSIKTRSFIRRCRPEQS